MYCHKLPDQIAPPDARFRRLAFVFQILSGQAKGNKRKHPRVLTNYRTTVNYDVRLQANTVFQLDFIAYN